MYVQYIFIIFVYVILTYIKNLNDQKLFKEARAGCGLKKRLRESFFYFCICNIHGIPSISVQKTIPHRDCSETGAISKYMSNVAFLYEIYMGKHYFSH